MDMMTHLTHAVTDAALMPVQPDIMVAVRALVWLACGIALWHLIRSWRLDKPTRQILAWRGVIAGGYVLFLVGFLASILITSLTDTNTPAYHLTIQLAVLARAVVDAASAGQRTREAKKGSDQ